MRAIYIRHADKDFKNGNSNLFKHDPGITETGVYHAKNIAQRLIEEYGEPVKIISSPYRRTRETALIMNSMCKNPFEDIQIDCSLSEYLGNHNNVPLDVTISTEIHRPPHPESFEAMRMRVKNHVDKIRKISEKKREKGEKGEIEKREEVVWFITHGIIIKQIGNLFNIKTGKQLPCLTCFSFIEKRGMVRCEFILFKNLITEDKQETYNKQDTQTKRLYPRFDRHMVPKTQHVGRDDVTGRHRKKK